MTISGQSSSALKDDQTPLSEQSSTQTEQDAGVADVTINRNLNEVLPIRNVFASAVAIIRKHALQTSISVMSLVVGVYLWHLATAYKVDLYINFQNVPPPLKVWSAFWTHMGQADFYIHMAVSMQRILTAYLTAAVLGIVIGVLMGRSRIARSVVYPYIEILRPIPAVAWIPLAILMWPTEEGSIVFITLLGALFPIILNTLHGVEQTPEVLVRAAKSLGASRLQIFRHVILPAALPSISAGLAIGMGVSWFSLLAGEIISGQYGIGYFTWDAYSLINFPDIVVGMLVIGCLGTLSTYAVRLAMKPFLAWQKRSR
ncbi:ABC transporter permease [Labrenzia sp. 011]|uniref:ABC transporter permease n=1 Tax=Labrenzia sp. 011 TaxID=2171494 RepID=UPI000D50AFC9|nr:ABC transporter permease [Labrenzia sp. 011]PVB62379.1 ABC transporter permease [Labrenzia sp. 011]